MKQPLILILILVVAVATATAQKPKVKPTYTPDKPTKSNGGGRAAGAPSDRSSSAAQELRRAEQSSAKVPGSGKTGANKTNTAAPIKADKSGVNPPIRLSGNGKGNGPRGKSGDPAKGRLRQKNH